MTDNKKGDEKCIGGKEYTYIPASKRGLGGQQPPAPATPAGLISQMASEAQKLADLIVAEYTYQGSYRNVPLLLIPANKTNYPVDIGFSARIFRLDTEFPITIRIGNTQADEIPLDHQTSPFDLPSIPAGLAFSTFYVTNPNNQDIVIKMFVMG